MSSDLAVGGEAGWERGGDPGRVKGGDMGRASRGQVAAVGIWGQGCSSQCMCWNPQYLAILRGYLT